MAKTKKPILDSKLNKKNSYKSYINFLYKNYLLNRTIVSKDNHLFFKNLEELIATKIKKYYYHSGMEIATWTVPPEWNLKSASLQTLNGKIVFTNKNHPLFVAPYSKSFKGKITLSELKKHLCWHKKLHKAFFYEHRLAYDEKRRLKEWRLSLPFIEVKKLPNTKYLVDIKVETKPGKMIVGELHLKGSSKKTICLLSDYCHPAQVNDSLSGLITMLLVFAELKKIKKRKYNYKLFLFPETIGSIIFLAKNKKIVSDTNLAIFSEFVGWGKKWLITKTDQSDNDIANKIANSIQRKWKNLQIGDIFSGYGNDELIFAFAGVPSMSLQMQDVKEYHSSEDEPSKIKKQNIEKAKSIILNIIYIMEKNEILYKKQNVPICMSKYGIYRDAVNEKNLFDKNRRILFNINNKNTILDIAKNCKTTFENVEKFSFELKKFGQLKK